VEDKEFWRLLFGVGYDKLEAPKGPTVTPLMYSLKPVFSPLLLAREDLLLLLLESILRRWELPGTER